MAVIHGTDALQQILGFGDQINASVLIQVPEHRGRKRKTDQRAVTVGFGDPQQQAEQTQPQKSFRREQQRTYHHARRQF